MLSAKSLSLGLLCAFAALGCGGSSNAPAVASTSTSAEVHGRAKTWEYAGPDGPQNWGNLEPDFALCKTGRHQSPVDLPPSPAIDPSVSVTPPHYAPVPLRVVNNGHTIKVFDTAPSSITVNGTTYALEEFHFHSPSEHTVNSKAFDGEMHLVHKSPDGKALAIAVFVVRGRESSLLKPLWDAMPTDATREENVVPGAAIDLASLLPHTPRYAYYEGSLTTPPCGEGVSWLVVEPDKTSVIELSDEQIARFRAVTHGKTNRPLQPLNGRAVVEVRPAP